MDTLQVLKDALYFLSVVNPISKVLFLSTYTPALTGRQNFQLSWQSSLAALLILLVLAFGGDFLLGTVFRIDLYSLKISGGIILFFTGYFAVRDGHFFLDERHKVENFRELSIVPLAAPLIAGPGTIAITLTFTQETGFLHAATVAAAALLLNFIMMAFSQPVGKILQRLKMTGPLIRLTGLVVATLAVQMILNGLNDWRGQ